MIKLYLINFIINKYIVIGNDGIGTLFLILAYVLTFLAFLLVLVFLSYLIFYPRFVNTFDVVNNYINKYKIPITKFFITIKSTISTRIKKIIIPVQKVKHVISTKYSTIKNRWKMMRDMIYIYFKKPFLAISTVVRTIILVILTVITIVRILLFYFEKKYLGWKNKRVRIAYEKEKKSVADREHEVYLLKTGQKKLKISIWNDQGDGTIDISNIYDVNYRRLYRLEHKLKKGEARLALYHGIGDIKKKIFREHQPLVTSFKQFIESDAHIGIIGFMKFFSFYITVGLLKLLIAALMFSWFFCCWWLTYLVYSGYLKTTSSLPPEIVAYINVFSQLHILKCVGVFCGLGWCLCLRGLWNMRWVTAIGTSICIFVFFHQCMEGFIIAQIGIDLFDNFRVEASSFDYKTLPFFINPLGSYFKIIQSVKKTLELICATLYSDIKRELEEEYKPQYSAWKVIGKEEAKRAFAWLLKLHIHILRLVAKIYTWLNKPL